MEKRNLVEVDKNCIVYPKYTSEEVNVLCDKLLYKPKYDNDAGRDAVRNITILLWIAMAIVCFTVAKLSIEYVFIIFCVGVIVSVTMLELLTLTDKIRARRRHQVWSKVDELQYRKLMTLKQNMSIIDDFATELSEYELSYPDFKILWDGHGLQLSHFDGMVYKVVHCNCEDISANTDTEGNIIEISMRKYDTKVEGFLSYGKLTRRDIEAYKDNEVTVYMPSVFNGQFGFKCCKCSTINKLHVNEEPTVCSRCEHELMPIRIQKKGTFQSKLDMLSKLAENGVVR